MFIHTITLCLATTLHGVAAPPTCGAVVAGNFTQYKSMEACVATLPSSFSLWWRTDAKLLHVQENEVQAAGCVPVPPTPTFDRD